jgi:molybdenum cofactor biosynthesis enzyme
MSAAHSGRNGGPGAPGQHDPAALIEDINRTRADLGDTVEALVAKVDVKAQARQRAAAVSTQVKENRVPFAVAAVTAAGAAALAGWLMVRRRR